MYVQLDKEKPVVANIKRLELGGGQVYDGSSV
jgi:hypothetical protein